MSGLPGIQPGGYAGFFNLESGEHERYSAKGYIAAERRPLPWCCRTVL
jgi:hypothetical protein